jgi:hypothetical protein
MLFYTFDVGNKSYKLRLATRNIIDLEKTLGTNPLGIFGSGDRIPTITEMVHILHFALQQYEHGITLNDAYTIFDEYIENGNTATDFIKVIVEVYKVSGIIKGSSDTEKN